MPAMTLGVLALAGLVGLVLAEVLIRRSDVAAGIVMVLTVLAVAVELPRWSLAGSVSVDLADLVFVLLLVAAVGRLLRVRRLSPLQVLMVAFGLLVLYSVLRGAASFGFQDAVNEARKYLYFTAGALYFSTATPGREVSDRLGWIWMVGAAAVLALALLRWAGAAAGVTGGILGTGGGVRVLPAAAALILAQGFFLSLHWWRRPTGPALRLAAPALLVTVLALQHRTVWVVCLVGLAVLLVRRRALARGFLASLTLGVAASAVLAFTVFEGAGEQIVADLSDRATDLRTFQWRVAGWEALITESGPGTVEEIAVGQPFGAGWERRVDGGVVHVSPHNFFVETYLRLGLAGLASLVAVYAIALRGLHFGRGPGGLLSGDALLAVLLTHLVYYITYTPDLSQSVLVGVAAGAVMVGSRPGPGPARTERVAVPA